MIDTSFANDQHDNRRTAAAYRALLCLTIAVGQISIDKQLVQPLLAKLNMCLAKIIGPVCCECCGFNNCGDCSPLIGVAAKDEPVDHDECSSV